MRATASTSGHRERLQNVNQATTVQIRTVEQLLSHMCSDLGKLTESEARGIGAEQGSNAAAGLLGRLTGNHYLWFRVSVLLCFTQSSVLLCLR